MVTWLGASIAATRGTIPAISGSSKVELTRNLASNSRTVCDSSFVAIRRPYRSTASGDEGWFSVCRNSRLVYLGEPMRLDQLALQVLARCIGERSVRTQLPRRYPVGH